MNWISRTLKAEKDWDPFSANVRNWYNEGGYSNNLPEGQKNRFMPPVL